jgi:hypothetical protein
MMPTVHRVYFCAGGRVTETRVLMPYYYQNKDMSTSNIDAFVNLSKAISAIPLQVFVWACYLGADPLSTPLWHPII